MYVLLIPAICVEISDSIYCLNTDHIDSNMADNVAVSKGDVICSATYQHLPKMGFSGFLKDTFGSQEKHRIDFKSPVSGTFQPVRKTTFHCRWRYRDYNKKFEIHNKKDEMSFEIAFRFFTHEKIALMAGAYYSEFFDLFTKRAHWADVGMRDSSYYDENWRENLSKEQAYFHNLVCPCLDVDAYQSR